MIDLTRIVGFDWDDGNSRKNRDRHSVTQLEAEEVFLDERLVVSNDVSHSQTESRYQALGQTSEGRHLFVSFTLRQDRTLIRVISARDINRKERARYEQAA
jgi:uncharacterized DUF497 family protein